MRVIDLLNKIANGEEVPTFRYLDRTLRYNKAKECFDDINDVRYCRTGFGYNGLNDEIEIIEEDKKIEKLENKIDTTFENYNYSERMRLTEMVNKINEIIDYLKEK